MSVARDQMVRNLTRLPPPDPPGRIAEDDPRWNPKTMGNRRGGADRLARRRRQNRNLPYGAKPKSVNRYGIPQFSSPSGSPSTPGPYGRRYVPGRV